MKVLLFSTAREAAGGASSLTFDGPRDRDRDLGELLEELGRRHPPLRQVIAASQIAVNGERVPPPYGGRRLAPGDEVAVLPPYSGG